MAELLALDLGLRAGIAVYGDDGRLRAYRSTNFGSMSRLKRAIPQVLDRVYGLSWMVAEGDRRLFEIWQREAERRGAETRWVQTLAWRNRMLFQREHRDRRTAKESATVLAREVIAWSGAPRPTSLRHDAAEAILIGLWGVLETGWLAELPAELRRGFG